VREVFSDLKDGPGPYTTRLGARPIAPALTTHRTRYDSRDCYVWEPDRGLRILDGNERDALAGLPRGWTAGFSEATRARMCGNAVVPALAEWLARRIER
jgi:site-specific DNA-cytosine methylase